MQPLIRAASLRGFGGVVTELGGDIGALLSAFGIDRALLDSDDGMLPITVHDRMLDAAAADLGCTDLGLRLAERQDLTVLGPVAGAIESSSTAAEAVECAAQFLFVHSPALMVGIDRDPWGRRGVIALTYRKDLTESEYSPQALELGLGLFYRVAERLLGRTAGLRSVEMPHGPLSPVDRYLEFFGTDVKFDRPVGALCVESRVLDYAVGTADIERRSVALDRLTTQFSDPRRSVANAVRRTIGRSLPGRIPHIDEVADSLSWHPRTLQRRLASEGTSYARVLDDWRRDRTYEYVTATDKPFRDVAVLVGFTEQSSLSHAVRRWFGVSTRELRARADLSS